MLFGATLRGRVAVSRFCLRRAFYVDLSKLSFLASFFYLFMDISEPRCWAEHSLCHLLKMSSLPQTGAPLCPTHPDPRARRESAGGLNVVSRHWDADGCELCLSRHSSLTQRVSVPTQVRGNCHSTPRSFWPTPNSPDSAHVGRRCYVSVAGIGITC